MFFAFVTETMFSVIPEHLAKLAKFSIPGIEWGLMTKF